MGLLGIGVMPCPLRRFPVAEFIAGATDEFSADPPSYVVIAPDGQEMDTRDD
jgi:hypothetical protein